MAQDIEGRLAALGITLPSAAPAAANYVPWTVSQGLLFVSGQLPLLDGRLVATGRLGERVDLETGRAAARACAQNLLAQAKAACGGDLGRLLRCLKLTGFVASAPDFVQHHLVMNGASDLIVAAMAEAGRHARAAVGVPCLPLDAAVEVEGIFAIA